MKKFITSAFLIIFYTITAQSYIPPNGYHPIYSSVLSVNSIGGDHAVFGVRSENSNKVLKYDEIIGSPYFDKQFHDATVAKDYEKTSVRYNCYLDEIEFEKDGKPLVLPKEEKFSRIIFLSANSTITLLDTKDNLAGYFFELTSGNFSLYKKNKTKFIDTVPAMHSYATDRPAVFKALNPVYYIKTENGFIKNPKNKKEIIEQIPDKKEALNTFFKENKIKFDKEEDLKKLVTFLNQ